MNPLRCRAVLMRFRMLSELSLLPFARDLIGHALRRHGYSAETAGDMVLCSDEAMTRWMEHALDGGLESWLEVEVVIEEDALKVILKGEGRSLEFGPPPSIHTLDEQSREWRSEGLAIQLITSLMDSMEYGHGRDGNMLTLTKRF